MGYVNTVSTIATGLSNVVKTAATLNFTKTLKAGTDAAKNLRSTVEADANYYRSIAAKNQQDLAASIQGLNKATSDSWDQTSQKAKNAAKAAADAQIAESKRAQSELEKAGKFDFTTQILGKPYADIVKDRTKAAEAAKKEAEQTEKTVKMAERTAALVGETSVRKELEYDIQNGIIQGTEDQIRRLREAADLEDRNTAAIEAKKKADQGAQKSARAGEAAAKKASAEAEREAKRREDEAKKLQDMYDDQVLSLEEQIYMIGKHGQLAKTTWDVTRGSLKDYNEEQKNSLLLLAAQVDSEEKLNDAREEANRERIRQLEQQADKMRDVNKAYQDTLNDISFEASILGKSADEQDRLNTLRQVGIGIDSDAGKVLNQSLKAYQDQRKAVEQQIEAMDTLRSSFSEGLSDWVKGTKSFKDAMLDTLDKINSRIIDMIVDNWTEQLFGSFGSAEGGKAGGQASGFFGKLFGVKDNSKVQEDLKNAAIGADGNMIMPFAQEAIMKIEAEVKSMSEQVVAIHENAMQNVSASVQQSATTSTEGVDHAVNSLIGKGDQAASDADSAASKVLGSVQSIASSTGVLSNSIVSNVLSIFQTLMGSMGSGGGGGSGWAGLISSFASSGGGGGGDWASSFAAFAGARANGGPVNALGLYRVNEQGPEVLTVGNEDFLMMGNRAGRVTANDQIGGNQMQQVNNFMIQGRMDRRTESQIAQDVGQRTQRAVMRNT